MQSGRGTVLISVKVPIKIISEANNRDHWTAKARRAKRQKWAVLSYLKSRQATIPCKIVMTRVGPKMLDFDNLVHGLKYVRDAVADFLIPGLKAGLADADPRLTWEYAQEKGGPKEFAVKIDINPVP